MAYNGKKIIEIHGISTENIGSHLMFLTILQEFRDESVQFAISPSPHGCSVGFMRDNKVVPIFGFEMRRREVLSAIVPEFLGKPLGFVPRSKIDYIFDASGYAYSDKFGLHPIEATTRKFSRFVNSGGRIFMLPQSFGPFDNAMTRKKMKSLAQTAVKIYARDRISLESMKRVDPVGTTVESAPDMTILLQNDEKEAGSQKSRSVAIVPNKRMIDQLQGEKFYFDFLTGAVRLIQRSGWEPFFLIFGGKEDLKIAESLNRCFKNPLKIVDDKDPLKLKMCISQAGAVIGSRYHALASALFTNTISFAMGWSHKYNTLFEDYGVENCLIDIFDRDDHGKIEQLNDVTWRSRFIEKIRKRNHDNFLLIRNALDSIKAELAI